jgi:hypothetical protein
MTALNIARQNSQCRLDCSITTTHSTLLLWMLHALYTPRFACLHFSVYHLRAATIIPLHILNTPLGTATNQRAWCPTNPCAIPCRGKDLSSATVPDPLRGPLTGYRELAPRSKAARRQPDH